MCCFSVSGKMTVKDEFELRNSGRSHESGEPRGLLGRTTGCVKDFFWHPETVPCEKLPARYGYIFRRKSRWEQVRFSAMVCGMDFCYAAETAFVIPLLLSLGLHSRFVSMIYSISPLVTFIALPVLGSLSDSCNSMLGRRRPFILLLSAGILLGLVFIPYGGRLGLLLGDREGPVTTSMRNSSNDSALSAHREWGIAFTVVGTVFLDFCADVNQSPCRAYLLDISLPVDHDSGLAAFSFMSGLGSAVGYVISALRWDIRLWGNILESQVILSFAVITIFYILFAASSMYSFPEIPLPLLRDPEMHREYMERMKTGGEKESTAFAKNCVLYTHEKEETINSSCASEEEVDPFRKEVGLGEYLRSIVLMPKCMWLLCLTNFLFGLSLISYNIFFSDFVGECVFQGDPAAPHDSRAFERYKEGVRFSCWGMAFCSLVCGLYSAFIEDHVRRFGGRVVFVGSALFNAAGMAMMAVLKDRVAVVLLSFNSGIMHTALSTLPYCLVAHYHSTKLFIGKKGPTRGIGTDVGISLSFIVFSQFFLSFGMSPVVDAFGTTAVTMWASALFSVIGAATATQLTYADT